MFAFTACFKTSSVAIAVVAIPFTTAEGAPASAIGPFQWPLAAKLRLYPPDQHFRREHFRAARPGATAPAAPAIA